MTPEQFIDKCGRADRTERQAAQEHFIDLCRMLGEPTPNEATIDETELEASTVASVVRCSSASGT